MLQFNRADFVATNSAFIKAEDSSISPLSAATSSPPPSAQSISFESALIKNAEQSRIPNELSKRMKEYYTSTEQQFSSLLADLFLISTGPAPIDYCETNYVVTPLIAEFWNTISNLGFCFVGIYGLFISIKVGLRWRWIYLSVLILLTGICSALYHATLTWIGLKLDECFENLACSMLVYLNKQSLWFLVVHHFFASIGIFFITAFLFTELHLVLSFFFGLRHLSQHTATSLRGPLIRATIFLVSGVVCWLIDRLACHAISPHWQLHAWWHIFIAASAQQALVLSVLTHGFEAKGKIEIREWYGLISYLHIDIHAKKQEDAVRLSSFSSALSARDLSFGQFPPNIGSAEKEYISEQREYARRMRQV